METLFCDRYKLRTPVNEDADESVVSRLKRQLNKHCIMFEDILKTRTKKEDPRNQNRAHLAEPFHEAWQ